MSSRVAKTARDLAIAIDDFAARAIVDFGCEVPRRAAPARDDKMRSERRSLKFHLANPVSLSVLDFA